ncbi:putative monooxygenase YcnE [compost metagenome]
MVEHSRAEPGILRYDLFVRESDTPIFYLFEHYADAAAIEAHRQSTHYQAYRTATVNWMAEPAQVHLARPVDVAPFN